MNSYLNLFLSKLYFPASVNANEKIAWLYFSSIPFWCSFYFYLQICDFTNFAQLHFCYVEMHFPPWSLFYSCHNWIYILLPHFLGASFFSSLCPAVLHSALLLYFCHAAFFLVFCQAAYLSRCFIFAFLYFYLTIAVLLPCTCTLSVHPYQSHTSLKLFFFPATLKCEVFCHNRRYSRYIMLNCWPTSVCSTRFTLNWNNVD